jgi:hypothetical protein
MPDNQTSGEAKPYILNLHKILATSKSYFSKC